MQSEAQGLVQLITKVKDGIKQQFSDQQWVVAEISDLSVNRTGHCYIELIEKDERSQKIVAKTRATIWAFVFRMIKPYFETTTKEQLRPGIKVLLKVSVEFHELYGFSLNVQDIDPQYTLGDMARKRAEIIDQLTKEGVINLNKELDFPLVPQKVAIVSSETAAGYGDFMNQLLHNSEGFVVHSELFQAIMQGDKTGESVTNALYQIFDRCDEFDVVVIIRGGGAKSELSSFDDYDLAFAITQFPIPVLTGIGHERDESIVDIVAHKKLKTPTAVAEFILDSFSDFSNHLEQLKQSVFALLLDDLDEKLSELTYFWERVNHNLRNKMEGQIAYLSRANEKLIGVVKSYYTNKDVLVQASASKLRMQVNNKLNKQELKLQNIQDKAKPIINYFFQKKEHQLGLFHSKQQLLDPQIILNRGFAYVTNKSGVVKSTKDVNEGESISVQLASGKLQAQIKSKE